MTEEDEISVLLLEDALKAIEKIQDEYWQEKGLAELVLYLPEPLLKEALKIALKIKDSQALAAIALKLAEIGQLQEALNLAGNVSGEYSRSQVLAVIASKLVEIGQLEAALSLTRNIGEYSRSKVLAAIASKLAEIGQLQQALNLVQSIKDEYKHSQVLIAIAPKLAEIGQLQQALNLAQNIKEEYSHSKILAAVALKLVEIGQLEAGLNLFGNIKGEYNHSKELAAIVLKLAEIRQLQEALNLAGNIGEYRCSQMLVAIVPKLGEIGQLEAALNLAQNIKDEYSRSKLLAAVAFKLVEIGQLEAGLNLFGNIKGEYNHSKELAAIVPKLAEIEQPELALNLVRNIEDKYSRSKVLAAIASKLVEIGQLQKALYLVQNVEDKNEQSEALAKLVLLLPIPKPLLKEALLAWNSKNKRPQFKVQAVLVNELAELGYLEEALAIAHIHSEIRQQQQAEVLAELVPRFVEIPPNTRNYLWQAILRELKVACFSENHRGGAYWDFANLLFKDVPTLLKVLAALGGMVAVAEAFCIVALKLRQIKSKALMEVPTLQVCSPRAISSNWSDWLEPEPTTLQKEAVPQLLRLIRYPYLDCPTHTVINQKFSLFVQLLIKPPNQEAEAVELQDTGVLEQLPDVEVVLRAHGFDIVGSNTKILLVERDDDSEERCILIPRCLGEQELRVDFYQHGRRLTTTRHTILVLEKLEEGVLPQPTLPMSIELKTKPTLSPPDLELCVELDRHDNQTLYFTLHSAHSKVGYHHTKLGQVTLQGSPLEKMQAAYQELSQMARPMQRTEQALAERRLAALGNKLWDELIPDQLKQEYWRFKSHIKTILITSDEPWIPWEAIKPYRFNDECEREEDSFWCQQFAISRWLSGPGTADELLVGTARAIAPFQSNLAAVKEEVAFIKQLNNLHPAIATLEPCCSSMEVLEWLERGKFSISHFACHGTFDATSPDNSAIMLSGIALRPSDVRARFGGRRMRPLIFINACHAARVEFSFTGLGGWAERLVKDAHVGAFVGAMWEVNDGLALRFAQRFYTAILQDNQNIAEAFRIAREEIRQLAPYNSSWLAYALYADPEGRFKEQLATDRGRTNSKKNGSSSAAPNLSNSRGSSQINKGARGDQDNDIKKFNGWKRYIIIALTSVFIVGGLILLIDVISNQANNSLQQRAFPKGKLEYK